MKIVCLLIMKIFLLTSPSKKSHTSKVEDELRPFPPHTEISKFINAYKSVSNRLLKKEFPQIRQKLWKEYFWSQSFCLLTTGGATIKVIKKYIESQGEKH